MEQTRKHLKFSSFAILALAGLSLINIVSELLFGELNGAEIPVGSPDHILFITKIILMAVSFLCLLPQVYIGIKGLKVAKNPDSSKGHIVWGIILLAFAIVGLISPLVSIIKQDYVFENVSELLSILVEVAFFYDYVKYARAVAKQINRIQKSLF